MFLFIYCVIIRTTVMVTLKNQMMKKPISGVMLTSPVQGNPCMYFLYIPCCPMQNNRRFVGHSTVIVCYRILVLE